MSNYEIIGQALAILRELLADYILQQLQTVPEYKVNDAWWQQGVLATVRDERDFDRLAPLVDYGERLDALDVAMCLNLMISHWSNLFKYRLPNAARSWLSEIREVRNDWAHFKGTDLRTKETARALDTMSLLVGAIDGEAQKEFKSSIAWWPMVRKWGPQPRPRIVQMPERAKKVSGRHAKHTGQGLAQLAKRHRTASRCGTGPLQECWLPYPFVASCTKTCVTAPIIFPFCMMGLPLIPCTIS